MKREQIMLKTINDVKAFVNSVAKYDFDVDLLSGRYAVDAKSIMGIFSLETFPRQSRWKFIRMTARIS